MRWAAVLLALAATSGCARSDGGGTGQQAARTVPVTITAANGAHVFHAEVASTKAEQAQGLMFRTDLADDFAMLFAPYPPDGGGPVEASFWMKNTPSPLDIMFIRADGTIARIAENAVPFSEESISSGEPIAAVVEVRGGRAAELGISEGDRVRWPASAVAKPVVDGGAAE